MTINEAKPQGMSKSQVPLLFGTVLIVYVGQMTLSPIIAPLSRRFGMPEWQLGVTISAVAAMVVLTFGFWGRRAQSKRFKPVLLAALALGIVTMILSSGLAAADIQGLLTGTVLFLLLVLLRGIGFGTAIVAVPPTAQVYTTEFTPEGPARVKGMARIGAVQGIASILGAIVGGALAEFGLLTPVTVVPVLIGITMPLVLACLRGGAGSRLVESPVRVSPMDKRVLPFLVAGFGTFTALGFIQNTASFIVMDRFHLDEVAGGQLSGVVMPAIGIGMVITQVVVVPVTKWAPPMLLRVGATVSTAGFVIMLPGAELQVMFVSALLIGLGIDIAMSGYTSRPTMLVEHDEQGGFAGVIDATNSLTYVLVPTLSTLFYGWWRPLPVIVSVVVLGVVAALVLTHPAFRSFRPDSETAVKEEARWLKERGVAVRRA